MGILKKYLMTGKFLNIHLYSFLFQDTLTSFFNVISIFFTATADPWIIWPKVFRKPVNHFTKLG